MPDRSAPGPLASAGDESSKSRHSTWIARGITLFVEHPVTNLMRGVALLAIGFSEASKTFTDDMTHGQLRLGHGLIIIGGFGVLAALPNLIDVLDAGRRYLEAREQRARSGPGTGTGTGIAPPAGIEAV